MASISITFNGTTALLNEMAQNFALASGYSSVLPDGTSNPVTPQQFAQSYLREYVKYTALKYKTDQAKNAVSVSDYTGTT